MRLQFLVLLLNFFAVLAESVHCILDMLQILLEMRLLLKLVLGLVDHFAQFRACLVEFLHFGLSLRIHLLKLLGHLGILVSQFLDVLLWIVNHISHVAIMILGHLLGDFWILLGQFHDVLFPVAFFHGFCKHILRGGHELIFVFLGFFFGIFPEFSALLLGPGEELDGVVSCPNNWFVNGLVLQLVEHKEGEWNDDKAVQCQDEHQDWVHEHEFAFFFQVVLIKLTFNELFFQCLLKEIIEITGAHSAWVRESSDDHPGELDQGGCVQKYENHLWRVSRIKANSLHQEVENDCCIDKESKEQHLVKVV